MIIVGARRTRRASRRLACTLVIVTVVRVAMMTPSESSVGISGMAGQMP